MTRAKTRREVDAGQSQGPDPGINTDSGYPTPWQFAKHAGCNPKCVQRARRVEVRVEAPARTRKRHVYATHELTHALIRAGITWRLGRVGGGATIYALTPREADGTPERPTKAKAFGNSERQALQNLADQLQVKYAVRCPR